MRNPNVSPAAIAEVLSMAAAMASLMMWLTGYMADKKQLHRHYQANSRKGRRIMLYLRGGIGVKSKTSETLNSLRGKGRCYQSLTLTI
ncbi:hypothetical protein AV650_08265 [Serratia fonticola]|nr:hypothetical protein AV650_08265 [Serratia fonticola]